MTRHGPASTRSAASALPAMSQLAPAIITGTVTGSGASRLRQPNRAILPRRRQSAAMMQRPCLGSLISRSNGK